MHFGADPKKPHAVCIYGSGGGSLSLPENFPLDQFLKKATCKKNKEKPQLYDCTFDYDPAKFNKRSGVYKHWEGGAVLLALVTAIALVIVAFALLYCFYLKGASASGGGHGGGGHGCGGSDKIRSGILRSVLGKSNKSNRSNKSGKGSSKVDSTKSGLKSKSHHGGKSPKSKKSLKGGGGKSLKKSGKK